MKCDKCKQTCRDKAMQVGACKICQVCIDVEESTDSVNVQNKLKVYELLAYVNTYRHQSSKLNNQMACMTFYADQVVLDAKQVLCVEYRHELGDPQNRQGSNNRSKAEQSVEDI